MRLLLTAPLLALLACHPVPMTEVASFGDAAASVAESSGEAFGLLNAAGGEQAAQVLIVLPPSDPAEAKLAWDNYDQAIDQGIIPPTGLADRQAMLVELSGYAASLSDLATADLKTEVEDASASYLETLLSLNERFADLTGSTPLLSSSTLVGVQQAVSLIGGTVLEAKRRSELRKIVPEADPLVQKASALLAADLKADGALAKGTEQLLTNKIRLLQVYYNTHASQLSLDERVALVDQVRLLHVQREETAALYTAASGAATALGAAHTALVSALGDRSVTPDRFVTALGSLTRAASKMEEIRARLGGSAEDTSASDTDTKGQ